MEIRIELSDALADILRQVADAFEIGRHAQCADDLTKVHCHWLAACDCKYGALFNGTLKAVDFEVRIDDAQAHRDVAANECVDGIHDLSFRQAAHFGDKPGQFLKVFVESLGCVI
jgi:hypothetical protein